MSEKEYRANTDGLNIVFGATLGFVLAGAEALSNAAFSLVVIVTISVVVSILYISASNKRLTYSIYALVVIVAMPWMFRSLLGQDFAMPSKLQPTLAIWAIFSTMIEFAPRDQSSR
jgi:hypothetical protein